MGFGTVLRAGHRRPPLQNQFQIGRPLCAGRIHKGGCSSRPIAWSGHSRPTALSSGLSQRSQHPRNFYQEGGSRSCVDQSFSGPVSAKLRVSRIILANCCAANAESQGSDHQRAYKRLMRNRSIAPMRALMVLGRFVTFRSALVST